MRQTMALRPRAAQQSGSQPEESTTSITARYTPFGGIPTRPTETLSQTDFPVSTSMAEPPLVSISSAANTSVPAERKTGTITYTRRPVPGNTLYTTFRGRPTGGIQTPQENQASGRVPSSTEDPISVATPAPPTLTSLPPTQSISENLYDQGKFSPRPTAMSIGSRSSSMARATPRPPNIPRPQNQQLPPYQDQPSPQPSSLNQPMPYSLGLPPIPGANRSNHCRNGYNPQCTRGTVCMRDPRSRADAAICVPATQMCGGKAEMGCDAGFICLEDPRVDW